METLLVNVLLQGKQVSKPHHVTVAYGFLFWTMNFTNLFGEKLVKKNGGQSVGTEEALKGKMFVGIYFSAHWLYMMFVLCCGYAQMII